ncbi:hypothetical protein GCM10023190_16300 [Enteractinococcus fodinae]
MPNACDIEFSGCELYNYLLTIHTVIISVMCVKSGVKWTVGGGVAELVAWRAQRDHALPYEPLRELRTSLFCSILTERSVIQA